MKGKRKWNEFGKGSRGERDGGGYSNYWPLGKLERG